MGSWRHISPKTDPRTHPQVVPSPRTAHFGEVEGGDGAAQAERVDLGQAEQGQRAQGQEGVQVLLPRHSSGLWQAGWGHATGVNPLQQPLNKSGAGRGGPIPGRGLPRFEVSTSLSKEVLRAPMVDRSSSAIRDVPITFTDKWWLPMGWEDEEGVGRPRGSLHC